jgi:predicted NAD/FAD-dependent oxidoreductase
MAGLAAAERLRAAGVGCVLFEKSRGFGGRMATRRTGPFQWDHGAQYFSARGPAFLAQAEHWRDAGLVAEWSPGAFVGAPSMTAPARAMAANHICVTSAQVTGLTRSARGWSVFGEAGLVDAPGNGGYAAVLLAVPAPQAVPLAQSAGVVLPGLAEAAYDPCIALLLAFARQGQGQCEDWTKPEDSTVAWIARNSSKPDRPGQAQMWIVHARPEWSREHLEDPPEIWRGALLARFVAITGVYGEPQQIAAHRWRYALVSQAVGRPCLFDETATLGACGDWCLGPRVEAAFDSGCALADTLTAAMP